MLDEIMSISRLRMGTDGKGVSTLEVHRCCIQNLYIKYVLWQTEGGQGE